MVILRSGTVLVHESLSGLRSRAAPGLIVRARQQEEEVRRALDAIGLAATIEGEWARVTVADPDETAPDVLRGLLAAGIDVVECRVARASLEDLFLEAVRATPQTEIEA